jgi:parallel beta-helix repeat protein
MTTYVPISSATAKTNLEADDKFPVAAHGENVAYHMTGMTLRQEISGALSVADYGNDIQATIDEAAAGDTIFIPNGTYSIPASLSLVSNLTIISNGAILQVAAGAGFNLFTATSKSYIKIYNLVLDGNKANVTGNSIGIFLVSCSDILISNCYIHDFTNCGIAGATSLTRSRITGCDVIDCGEVGATSKHGIFLYGGITDVKVDNNHVAGAAGSGILITSNGTSNITGVNLSNNRVKDCGSMGVWLAGDASHYVTDSNVEENIVTGCVDQVELAYCADVPVTGNTGNRGDVDGIVLQNCVRCPVTGNTASYNGARGINLQDTSYCSVNGNTTNSNDQSATGGISGIDLYETSLYNTVVGNTCLDFGGSPTQDYGIGESATSDYNIIIGNNVTGNAVGGINKQGTNTVVRNNKGWITEAHGLVVIGSAATYVTFDHGMSVTPEYKDISVNFGPGGGGNAKTVYCTAITSSQLTFTVDAAPGADKTLSWQAHVL